jgi:hypothetical protein
MSDPNPYETPRTESSDEPSNKLLCTACFRRVHAPTKVSFFGFPKFECPRCGAAVVHPLSPVRRVSYWVVVGVFSAIVIGCWVAGFVATPGMLFFLVGYALVKDREHRQLYLVAENTAAERRARKRKMARTAEK